MKKKELKKIIIWTIIALIIILTIGIFIYKTYFKTEVKKESSNITDIITSNGEMVSYKYNNYLFEKKDGVWYTQIQKGKQPFVIAFIYGPINVENLTINFELNDFQKYTTPGRKVYVTFDHDSTNASYIATAAINIINNLKTVYGVNSQRACMRNSTNCAGAPIITCENTNNTVVIQFVDSVKTDITYKDNCLTIKSSKEGYIKAAEKIVLNWYKIL